MAAAYEIPEESLQALRDCLASYDKSGDGVLSKDDFSGALTFAGITATPETASFLAHSFDKNGDGRLQIDELCANWYTLVQHSVNGEMLEKAFRKLDRNGDGFVKILELQRVLTGTGDKMTGDEVAELAHLLLKDFDKDGDGKFSYPEFVMMFDQGAFPFKKPVVESKDISENFRIEHTS